MDNTSKEITFELVEPIGILSEGTTGWNKELNLVRWNNGAVKFDIRDWKEDHTAMSRGITFHKNEAQALLELLKNYDFSKNIENKKEEEIEM